jgi:hypothetical protein
MPFVNVNCYSGMQIVPTRTVPVKEHRLRPNMKMSYHQRTSKKWLKRYGTKQVRAYPIAASVGF